MLHQAKQASLKIRRIFQDFSVSLRLCGENKRPTPNLHCKKKKALTNESGRIGPSKSQITKSDEQVLIPEYFGPNSRIFKDHPCKCLTPKDRGGTGYSMNWQK
jgi:hypothetical protein